MFAAAKNGYVFGERVHKDGSFRLGKKVLKFFFKKRLKNYCGNKKRVLYLHPLKAGMF